MISLTNFVNCFADMILSRLLYCHILPTWFYSCSFIKVKFTACPRSLVRFLITVRTSQKSWHILQSKMLYKMGQGTCSNWSIFLFLFLFSGSHQGTYQLEHAEEIKSSFIILDVVYFFFCILKYYCISIFLTYTLSLPLNKRMIRFEPNCGFVRSSFSSFWPSNRQSIAITLNYKLWVTTSWTVYFYLHWNSFKKISLDWPPELAI